MVSLDRESSSEKDKPDDKEPLEPDVSELNPLENLVLFHKGETVYEVLGDVSAAKGVSRDSAAEGLLRAIDDGIVRLVDPDPPKGFFGYFFSFYSVWFWFAICIVVLVLVSIYILPQIYPFEFVRYGVSGIFVLLIPGYVFLEALYPKAGDLVGLERFVLDIICSIAIVGFVGMILNYTSWGIQLNPIIICLSVVVVSLGLIGTFRKYGKR